MEVSHDIALRPYYYRVLPPRDVFWQRFHCKGLTIGKTDGNTTYEVGSFDGRTFRPEQAMRKLKPDGKAYAAQTWNDVSESDGRRIQIAWLRPGHLIEAEIAGELLDIEAEIDLRSVDSAGVLARGVPVFYDRRLGAFVCGRCTALLPPGKASSNCASSQTERQWRCMRAVVR